jgi:hypothetical protein
VTVFRIREPRGEIRKAQLCNKSGQLLDTTPGHEKALLNLAKRMVAAESLQEADGAGRFFLDKKTSILSCEVTL